MVKGFNINGLQQTMALVLLLFCAVVHSNENASVAVRASTLEMTPGQQFELQLTVAHDEDIEAVFNPRQQNWNELEFIDYSVTKPRWQQHQWLSTYTLQVAVSVAGEYQLSALKVSFYRGADRWNLETTPLPYKVISLFLGVPEIQPVLSLPANPVSSTPLNPVVWFVMAPLVLMGILIGWRFGMGSIKPMRLWNSSLKSPKTLAQQALQQGVIDWESLRLWLIVESGSDPLGRLTTEENLLHQYQQIRFTEGTDHQAYVDLCHRCQERWG